MMIGRGIRRLGAALLAWAVLVSSLAAFGPVEAVQAATGNVYYVDALDGDDSGAGTSAAAAWQTLNKVNASTFGPGDTILFKAGGVWMGTLHPKGSGSDGFPILIDRYGEGPKPLIAGNGADAAVYFYNQEYWEVRNLEITNYASEPGQRRGIHVAGTSGGWTNPKVYRHFVFEHLDIHSVRGTPGGWHSGGIIVWDPDWNYIVSDVVINNNKIYSLDSVGIYLNGGSFTFASGNQVTNNTIYDIAADGAFVLNTTNALIEHNVVYDTHKRASGYHVPLWTFETRDALIQYNEVFNTYPGGDAMAYDSDYRSRGTIIQYNYSHNNAGGAYMVTSDGSSASNYNTDSIVRYNISQNDLGAVFTISGNPENTHIYNNTVYIGEGLNTRMTDFLHWHAWPKDTYFYNNILVNHGTGGYVFGGDSGSIYFDNNLFWGNHAAAALDKDANKIVADPLLAAPGTAAIGRDTVHGYQLLELSPAIGAGKVVEDNGGQDFWGNPVSATEAPNIGAYEGPGLDPDNLPPLPTHTNLLADPGFESGDFSGWPNFYGGAEIVEEHARSGSYAAKLSNAVSGVEQIVELKANTIYKLYAHARAEGGGSAVFGVKDYGGATKDIHMSSTAYTGREIVFTTGEAAVNAAIYMYKGGGAGTVYFDDFMLIEYGEVLPPAEPPELPAEPLPGKQNLAPLSHVTASSTNGAFVPGNAVDGNRSDGASRWISNGGEQPPHWLMMEWEQSYVIDRVRVWSGAGAGAPGWHIRGFEIQYWDGSGWQTAATVTGNDKDGHFGQFNDLVFEPLSTDKVRVYITQGTNPDNGGRLFEVEVWEHDEDGGVIVAPPVYAFAVDVKGQHNAVSVDAGESLQMEASVKPANATDHSVAWSVHGEDGGATALADIDAQGLLSAYGSGTVVVRAVAGDGSGVSGSRLVTITEHPGIPNIASLATASASSSHENGAFPPQNAVNGNRYSSPDRWITTDDEGSHWLQLNWEDRYDIERVRLWSGQSVAVGWQLADFAIQYWDGSGWATAATVTGNDKDAYYGEFNDLIFAPVSTNALRLHITEANSQNDNRVRLFELEAYGTPASSPGEAGASLSGDSVVVAGQSFSVTASVYGIVQPYSAVDVIVHYDPDVLEFDVELNQDEELSLQEGALEALREHLQVIGSGVKEDAGQIKIILISAGGELTGDGALFQLNGRVKAAAPAGATAMSLSELVLSSSEASMQPDTGGAKLLLTVLQADRSDLGAAIDAAKLVHNAAVEGPSPGQYPSGSKGTLWLAIGAAEGIYAMAGATQQQVNEALAALTDAVNAFKNSVRPEIPIDKTELAAVAAAARELHGKAVAGVKVGQYPAAAKSALWTAIETAEVVLQSGSAGQSEVDNAAAALRDKIGEFRTTLVTLTPGEAQITIRTLSIMAKYFGVKEGEIGWSEVEAADIYDQKEMTIQALAAVARMIISDWLNE